MRLSVLALACLCWSFAGMVQAAPEATTRVSPGPYFVGVPVHVEVRASGIEESPAPHVSVDAPDGAELVLVSAAPRISSSIQIINGKMTRWKDVTYVMRYRLTPSREGSIKVGPFEVTQGQLALVAPARQVDVGNVPQSDDQYLTVRWPERTLWVGERVPVEIEWWVSASLAERIASRSVHIPLFNMTEALSFSPASDRSAQNTLVVQTSAGRVELPAEVRREQRDGRDFLVLRAERIMTPLAAARLTMEPATVVVEEAVRWQRNLFGERVATDVRRVQAQSEPGEILIREPPKSGRPASFAGIVGSGFTVTVSANRSVVAAGDPIGLEVTVRGDGALDTLALPAFSALGLRAEDFKTPANAVTGRLEADGAKRFRFNVRPLHARVDAIPALTLSWFDANTGQYASTQSDPVALAVRAAKHVGAADVVSNAQEVQADQPDTSDKPSTETPNGRAAAAPAAVSNAAEFSDLSIETRPDRLTGATRVPSGSWWFYASAYAAALGLLLGSFLWRRRRNIEPQVRARKALIAQARETASRATSAAELSQTVRELAAAFGANSMRDEVDAVLAACDAVQYSRQACHPDTLESLRERAQGLIQQWHTA